MSVEFNARNQRRRKIAEAAKKRRREELAALVDKIKTEIFSDQDEERFSLTDCDPAKGDEDCDVIELVFE